LRIIARYRRWGYRYWGFLPTFLKIDDLGIGGRIDFLLDTGAGETILSERDAQRIGLPYRNFPRGRNARGVGGTAHTYKIDKEATFYMLTTEEEICSVKRRFIEVLEEPTPEKELPSILGLEFLEELNFKLTFDMPVIAIYLER